MRFFVLLLILSLGLQAQPWEKPSASEGLVVWRSAAKVLGAGDEEALEAVLGAINDSTSTQILVLFVDRVKDDLNFVAAQTGEAWGIGQAETDNGMLVLIALEDRKMAIQVGRGLEPTITDLVSHQLIENTLKPAFRNQDYRGGVQALAQEVAQRLSGQFDAAPGKERKLPFVPILIALAAIFALSSRGGGRGPGGMMFGPMGGMPLGGGGFGGRGGGGFGGGGFGGGGFGGFGGGSFGGGGASGSW